MHKQKKYIILLSFSAICIGILCFFSGYSFAQNQVNASPLLQGTFVLSYRNPTGTDTIAVLPANHSAAENEGQYIFVNNLNGQIVAQEITKTSDHAIVAVPDDIP